MRTGCVKAGQRRESNPLITPCSEGQTHVLRHRTSLTKHHLLRLTGSLKPFGGLCRKSTFELKSDCSSYVSITLLWHNTPLSAKDRQCQTSTWSTCQSILYISVLYRGRCLTFTLGYLSLLGNRFAQRTVASRLAFGKRRLHLRRTNQNTQRHIFIQLHQTRGEDVGLWSHKQTLSESGSVNATAARLIRLH